jgi:hypothetical protein
MQRNRGVALITVLLASALLLVLVAVLVDLGTIQLQRTTSDLRALQALAGADAGSAWVRAVLEEQRGNVVATIAKLGTTQGRRRFIVDDRTYVVTTVTVIQPSPQPTANDHYDVNLEQNPQVVETPLQVGASAAVYVDAQTVARRSTTTLLRVFPAAPYSAVVGVIDEGGPVGIDSPGDAGGQDAAPDTTELLVHAYVLDPFGHRQRVDQLGNAQWSDGNSAGPGPLP